MKFFSYILILGAFCLLCSGCFPVRWQTSPGLCGVVVNAQTHAPVAGAQAVIAPIYHSDPSADEIITNKQALIVATDASGHFSSPPQIRWRLFVVGFMGHPVPPHAALIVRSDGYEPVVRSVWSWQTTTNLGDILLCPATK
jgi:hypothetical protein